MTTIDTHYQLRIEGAPGVDAVFHDGRDPYFAVELRAGAAQEVLAISVDEKDAETFAERLAEAASSILETLRSRRLVAVETVPHCNYCVLPHPLPCARKDAALKLAKHRQAEACEEVARHGIGVTALDEHGQDVKVS